MANTLDKAKVRTLLDTQSNVEAELLFSRLGDEKAKKQILKLALQTTRYTLRCGGCGTGRHARRGT